MNKLILTAAVIAAAAMTVSSCNKNTENTGLSVDAEAISYPLSGGTYDINLTSGKPWKALYCTEWLTVTPESGEGDATVTIGVDPWVNEDSEEARLAGVHLTDNTDTVLVLINQVNDDNFGRPSVDHVSRPSAYLRLSSNNIQSPSQGGAFTISIDSNTGWEIICDADWISLSAKEGSYWKEITVNVSEWENPGNEEKRSAAFHVRYYQPPMHDFWSESVLVEQHNDNTGL